MADTLDRLAAEVDKVTGSPYLVSLKALHNILLGCDSFVVGQWADTHPHQTQQLASTVVQSLSLWTYTLDVVHLLAPVRSLRDAILCKSPALLNQFLERAITSDGGYDQYAQICVKLLSDPLPSGIPLPAAAQTLLGQLFDKALQSPSALTVEPVYLLLDGACFDLLDILPPSQLDKFREHLLRMMRTVKTIEDQLLSLFCLAITAQLNRSQYDQKSSVLTNDTALGQTLAINVSQSREEVHKLFRGNRAPKTLQLLVLQVIYACQSGAKGSGDLALKHVRLARRVLEALDQGAREAWRQANQTMVRKLHEKLAQSDLPLHVHLEAFAFTATLSVGNNFTDEAVAQFERLLLNLGASRSCYRTSSEALTRALPVLMPRFSVAFWTTLLHRILKMFDGTGAVADRDVNCFEGLLRQIRSNIPNDALSRKALMQALRSNEISTLVHNALQHASEDPYRQPGTRSSHSGYIQPSPVLRDLRTEICSLLLETAFYAQEEETKLEVPLALTLLTGLIDKTPRSPSYHVRQNTNIVPISIVEQCSTPEEHGASYQWRQKLAFELSVETKHRQDSIQRLMGQVCRDLEKRCENVEEPLRLEQSRLKDLRDEFEALQSRGKQLEEKLADRMTDIESLRKTNTELQTNLNSALLSVETVAHQNEALQETLERTREDNERMLAATRSDFDQQKLDLCTSIAFNVERLDEQQAEITTLKRKLQDTTGLLEEQRSESANRVCFFERSLEDLTAKLSSGETERERKNEEIGRLTARETSLSASKELLERQLHDVEALNGQLLRAKEEDLRVWEQEQQNMQSEHQIQIAQLSTQSSIVRQELEGIIRAKDMESEDFREASETELRDRDERIQELQRKSQKYLKECELKTLQLEEAQKLKARLLMALGLDNGEALLGRGTIEAVEEEASQTRQPHGTRRPKPNVVVLHSKEAIQYNNSESDPEPQSSFNSSISSQGASPTKRVKQRTSYTTFKVPTMRQPDTNARHLPMTAVRKRHSTGREPLVEATNSALNLKSGTRRRSEFVTASKMRSINAEEDIVGNDHVHGEFERCNETGRTSPVKGMQDVSWRRKASTENDDFAELVTQDFEGTTVEF